MVYSTVAQIAVRIMPIFNIMNVDIIRDKVMDQVAPIDVLNFVIGTGIRFSRKDMERYKSIIKYIIPNRRWLQSKIESGYCFTFLSNHLDKLINTNGYDLRRRISSMTSIRPKTKDVRMTGMLIVTKDEQTVACTREFMTGSGIVDWPSYEILITGASMSIRGLQTTTLHYNVDMVQVKLVCISEETSVDGLLHIEEGNSMFSYLFGLVDESVIMYMHLKQNQTVRMRRSVCRSVTIPEAHPNSQNTMNIACGDWYSDTPSYRVHSISL
jgi:hypothetical protein